MMIGIYGHERKSYIQLSDGASSLFSCQIPDLYFEAGKCCYL